MYRLLCRGLAPFVLTTALVLVSGCSAATASNTPASPQATATPLAENLTFHGDISGTLTVGLDPRPLTHDNPMPDVVEQPDGSFYQLAPRWTQCSTFDSNNTGTLDDYVAVIVGVISGKRYAVDFEISMDGPAYTKPGTALLLPDNLNGSVEVIEAGGQHRQWSDVLGPSEQNTVVVLHADRKSGTVDAWLVWPNGQSLDGLTGTLHLQGDWRCG